MGNLGTNPCWQVKKLCCVLLYNQKQAQLGVPHSRIQVELGFILQVELARFLILLRIQDRARVKKKLHWGGHRTEKMYTGRGGHRTYFVDESNTWGGDQ